jgi:hypothetical protein
MHNTKQDHWLGFGLISQLKLYRYFKDKDIAIFKQVVGIHMTYLLTGFTNVTVIDIAPH